MSVSKYSILYEKSSQYSLQLDYFKNTAQGKVCQFRFKIPNIDDPDVYCLSEEESLELRDFLNYCYPKDEK